LEIINLGPKQIKFLINIKNEKAFRDFGSGLVEILSYRLWENPAKQQNYFFKKAQ